MVPRPGLFGRHEPDENRNTLRFARGRITHDHATGQHDTLTRWRPGPRPDRRLRRDLSERAERLDRQRGPTCDRPGSRRRAGPARLGRDGVLARVRGRDPLLRPARRCLRRAPLLRRRPGRVRGRLAALRPGAELPAPDPRPGHPVGRWRGDPRARDDAGLAGVSAPPDGDRRRADEHDGRRRVRDRPDPRRLRRQHLRLARRVRHRRARRPAGPGVVAAPAPRWRRPRSGQGTARRLGRPLPGRCDQRWAARRDRGVQEWPDLAECLRGWQSVAWRDGGASRPAALDGVPVHPARAPGERRLPRRQHDHRLRLEPATSA